MPDDPFAPGEQCPKCRTPREAGARTCPCCGIVYERFRGSRTGSSPSAPTAEPLAPAPGFAPPPSLSPERSAPPGLPDVWDGGLPDTFAPRGDAGAPPTAAPKPYAAARTAPPAQAASQAARFDSPPDRDAGYVRRVLKRFAIGFGVVLLLAVVTRFTVIEPAVAKMKESLAASSSTTPASEPVAASSPAADENRSTVAPMALAASLVLGVPCVAIVVGIPLFVMAWAFFVWLAALALGVEDRFGAALGVVARTFLLCIPIGIFYSMVSFGAERWTQQILSYGASVLAGSVGAAWGYGLSFGRGATLYVLASVMEWVGLLLAGGLVSAILFAGVLA